MSQISLHPAARAARRRKRFPPWYAKETDPGPFTMGVRAARLLGAPKTLRIQRGAQIGGNFYANFDSNQGWLVCWLTPTWDGDDDAAHYILHWSANGFLRKNASNNLELSVADGVTLTVDASGWSASTTYRIEARWDADNALDASDNHLCLSVDDSHTFGRTTDYTPEAPAAYIYCGSDSAGANTAEAIIAGLTIYRRPGWDGTNGVNMGRGDEIALTGDKTYTTGSWDVVFCLPTDGETGAVDNTWDAWSHPAASNLITAVNGFMLHATAWTGWSDEGTPINSAALTEAQKIYGGGYQYESDAANEGKYVDLTVTETDNWIVRAVGHSDGTSVPKVILYDVTNSKEIGSLTGTTSSTRSAPDVFVFSGEANANRKAYSNMLYTAAPSDGDTVTVGPYIYTYKNDTSNPGPNDIYVKINGTTPSRIFLMYALNNNFGGSYPGIYEYGSNRGANPDVTLGTGDMPEARVAGAAGNGLAMTTTSAAISLDAAGTLTDGSDDTDQTTLRVKLINTAASGVTCWHQIEVLTNRASNSSVEHGNGNPFLPRGCEDSLTRSPGMAEISNDAHTGSYSRLVHSSTHCIFSYVPGVGTWVAGGCWTKVVDAGGSIRFVAAPSASYGLNDGTRAGGPFGASNETTDWVLGMGVARPFGLAQGAVFLSGDADYDKLADDAFLFPLNAVTLNYIQIPDPPAPPGGGDVDWSQWFDHCWVAKGADDLAASYVDLVGASDLTTAAAPTFDAATGWTFNGSTQYLNTGIQISNTETEIWSYMVQFSDAPTAEQYNNTVFGAYNVQCRPTWGGTYHVHAGNGGPGEHEAPHMVAGNFCIAGLGTYRDGVSSFALAGGTTGNTSYLYIGSSCDGSTPFNFYSGKVQAFGIKHGILTAEQVAAAVAAMAAL